MHDARSTCAALDRRDECGPSAPKRRGACAEPWYAAVCVKQRVFMGGRDGRSSRAEWGIYRTMVGGIGSDVGVRGAGGRATSYEWRRAMVGLEM